MQRVLNDENAAVPATSVGKNVLLSTKKSHKSALGDLKNTIHNTPMGAIPKTPFHASRLKPKASPVCNTPVNRPMNSVSVKKASLPAVSSIVKPKKKKSSARIFYDLEKVMYEDLIPGCSFKDDEPCLDEMWAKQDMLTDEEIKKIIQSTMYHDPVNEIPPKFYPYIDEIPMMPPPSPEPEFNFLPPPMIPFDFLDEEFASLNLEN
ncbi:hypothetical protein DMENIID0001_089010 [Sergentomyia squamirostris]